MISRKQKRKCEYYYSQYLKDMWHGLQQLEQFGVAIVRDTTLLCKVMVVRRYELAHGHDARWLTPQQVNDLSAELNELWVTHGTLAALDPWLCGKQFHIHNKSKSQ